MKVFIDILMLDFLNIGCLEEMFDYDSIMDDDLDDEDCSDDEVVDSGSEYEGKFSYS